MVSSHEVFNAVVIITTFHQINQTCLQAWPLKKYVLAGSHYSAIKATRHCVAKETFEKKNLGHSWLHTGRSVSYLHRSQVQSQHYNPRSSDFPLCTPTDSHERAHVNVVWGNLLRNILYLCKHMSKCLLELFVRITCCACVCEWHWGHMSQCRRRGQKTTLWTWFSPSTFLDSGDQTNSCSQTPLATASAHGAISSALMLSLNSMV